MINEPVINIKGVGDKLYQSLVGMDIRTINDLLFYFPNRYDNYEIKPLNQLVHNEKVTIEGEIIGEPSLTFYGRKKSRLVLNVQVEHMVVKGVMFNRAFAKKQLQAGEIVTLTGKWDQHRLQITISNYKKGRAKAEDPIQPIYPLKGDVTTRQLKKLISTALTQYSHEVVEILPDEYLESYKLPPRSEALKQMHYPANFQALKHAKRRFIYEEFLLFQLKMQLLRKRHKEATEGNSQAYDYRKVDHFISRLPFKLTDAQNKSLKEILKDLESPYRMNRLLQGDVGSGKTAVAAISLYASLTAGKQSALMVPTEILAEQHYQSFKELFEGYANVVLLTGSIKGKKRKEILAKIKSQEANIIVGTHALIQDEVLFSNLGTVIIDEQHRFGVNQRKTLRDKGIHPDVLFMTATPIPRTLAITTFGDMDVSQIDEMPLGRKEIETYWVKEQMLDRVLDFIAKEVEQGHQAYVICPLIEESDKLDIQNAVDLYHQLQANYEPNIKVGLMHGRLHSNEKEEVMRQYAQNQIQVLVSTTVVEVGVNVPNATVMVIYDAERFGLSQLHQLRGRVGRGESQSYCILLADPKGDVGKERMRIMTETINGFELSEQDLQLRGPGDFFGKKQSGLPEFKVGDMVHDYRALETARNDAQDIINAGWLQNNPNYSRLYKLLKQEVILNGETLD
ncbi:ATP-dependent DNA helicase RecG [Aquibacillus rhizosphaerae]|uniref:ATP-dependent DNA helicase RecG n=1 Tax=Aquibacillus rhizosphaerae TaxID=3051431 RepID=A0ABT7L617_9BACI|nr:ATP-dependent DNA helicase RecG [Aquibacillus sp. LR5S19]MDL4840025.1 ATP-dependent DNA helicase RecG [Aquibacillus sp. LR5S19]